MRLIAFLLIACVSANDLKAEWTQFSDSASLPMSKQYRDQVRERIEKIDLNSLSSEERAKIEHLKEALGGDNHDPYDDPDYVSVFHAFSFFHVAVIGALITILGLIFYSRKKSSTILIPDPEQIRAARLAKYE